MRSTATQLQVTTLRTVLCVGYIPFVCRAAGLVPFPSIQEEGVSMVVLEPFPQERQKPLAFVLKVSLLHSSLCGC